MPSVDCCSTTCDTTAINTNVPGDSGQDAFTTLTANLTIPAVDATVVGSVANSDWMAIGGSYFLSDGVDWGHFSVQSINSATSVTFVFLGQNDDASPGAIIGSGGKVVASGQQQEVTLPLPIADGGTGQSTKADAILALGVGQVATADNNAGLAYDITNSPAQITGVAAVATATGNYNILAVVTVDYTGATFASNRILTITIRNVTQSTNLISVARNTGIQTTATQPSQDYVAFVGATLTSGDSIQVYISLDTVESAGSSVVTACNLALQPIAV